jgi:ubiquinol-cytochrome c reductase iron-sulfur subunit
MTIWNHITSYAFAFREFVAPTYRPDVAPADLGADWQGGFFCACHGSRFDLAGRVFSGVPAPTNLIVPPHRYVSDTVILIGEDEETA